MSIPRFKSRLKSALRSTDLELALDRALPTLSQRRNERFANSNFQTTQDALAKIRDDAISSLPDLIDQFMSEAKEAGSFVYVATDALEARTLAGKICTQSEAKLIVKGKSNLTEEIGLNEHLEDLGLEVVETDLGEWIVQIAEDRPSHTLAPALHLTREAISKLISTATERHVPDRREALVAAGREKLRRAFIEADVGISGGNFAIADTGTVVVVTNEGNDRLLSTLPPVYIAIIGVEKIVPTMQDVTDILPALTGSATGQKISTYVSLMTGPSRSADIEGIPTLGAHGPKEVHIILVDNGRLAMRDDRDFQSALRCVKCGACSNVCPPFRIVGGHAFGYIYSGPIGLVVTGHHHGFENIAEPQSLCVGCNACETVCPVGIPLPKLIGEVRIRTTEQKRGSLIKRSILRRIADPKQLEAGLRLATKAQLPLTWGGDFTRLPIPGIQTAWRKLPAVANNPLRDRRDAITSVKVKQIHGSKAVGLTVAYFPGCMTDWLYPEMGMAAIQVMRACGATVTYPEAPSCCGLPALNAGESRSASRMAKQTIEWLESVEADFILSTSASCAVMIKNDYVQLLRDDPSWLKRAQMLSTRIIDFAGFMQRAARLPDGSLLARNPNLTVTYHDACQTNNVLGVRDEQRRIITNVMGLQLREMSDSSMCCGFGGSFSFEHPDVSSRLLNRKLRQASKSNATIIVTDNPGCIMQMRGGLKAQGSDITVLHLAELMGRYLPD